MATCSTYFILFLQKWHQSGAKIPEEVCEEVKKDNCEDIEYDQLTQHTECQDKVDSFITKFETVIESKCDVIEVPGKCETVNNEKCEDEEREICETVNEQECTDEKKEECGTEYKTIYEKKEQCITMYTQECKV